MSAPRTRAPRGPSRAVLGWALLALLGLAIAGGAAYAASRLTSESPGLTSEPLGAGRELIPRAALTATPGRQGRPIATPTVAPATVSATPSAAGTPRRDADDHGGRTDDLPGHHDDD